MKRNHVDESISLSMNGPTLPSLAAVLLWLVILGANARTYTYDDQGRFTRVAYPEGGGISYVYDAAGNMTSMTRLDLPAAPNNLTAVRGLETITLNWSDRSNDETGFLLYRRVDGALETVPWELIATLAANTTSHIDNDITPQKTYEYKVAANSGDGPSAETKIVQSEDPIPFDLVSSGIIEDDGNEEQMIITIPSTSGSVYAVEVSNDMIRWSKSPIANGTAAGDLEPGEVWTSAQGDFLGHPTEDTTTVVIDVPPNSKAKFYRVLRQ